MENKEQMLKEAYKNLIFMVGLLCPNGREKSIAITNIETGYLWAKESLKEEDKNEQEN